MKIQDRLDAEIEALEKAQYGATGTQAESDAADETPSSASDGQDPTPSPANEIVLDPHQEVQIAQPNQEVEERKPQKRVSWKQRYSTLKAHHDTARFKDRQVIDQAFSRIAALEKENIKLREMLNSAPKVSSPKDFADVLTDEERDVLGDEGVASIDKLTQRAVEAAVAPLRERIAQQDAERITLSEQRAAEAREEAKSIFKQRLAKLVPDYAEIDLDPAFEAYLMAPDPTTGEKRFEYFKVAHSAGDVQRVADFFNAFKAIHRPPRPSLETKVTPVGNTGTPPTHVNPQQGNVEVLSFADYEKFMRDVNKGRYRNRQSEAKEIEARFDRAMLEGRMRP